MAKKKGFTLIELLVVIAIIALLLAILIPTLKKAKENAMRAMCLSDIRTLSQIMHIYANDHDSRVPSGHTEGAYAWVNHDGGLPYYNLDNDPVIEEQQRQAIRNGLLWPYCGDSEKLFRCPTSRRGSARSYSIPDSFAYDKLGLLAVNGANENMLIKKISKVRNSSMRMMFIDEGWSTPTSWSIMYATQQWWDIVPMMHGFGTNIGYIDGHADYRKWSDERTRNFAKDAMELANPNDATYWRRTEHGNNDIKFLVSAVWGKIGW